MGASLSGLPHCQGAQRGFCAASAPQRPDSFVPEARSFCVPPLCNGIQSASCSSLLVLSNPVSVNATSDLHPDASDLLPLLGSLPPSVREALEHAFSAMWSHCPASLASFSFDSLFAILDVGASRTLYTRGFLQKFAAEQGLWWDEKPSPRPCRTITANSPVQVQRLAIIPCHSPSSGDLHLECDILETDAITHILIGNASLIPLRAVFSYATGILSIPNHQSLHFKHAHNNLFYLNIIQPPRLRPASRAESSHPADPACPGPPLILAANSGPISPSPTDPLQPAHKSALKSSPSPSHGKRVSWPSEQDELVHVHYFEPRDPVGFSPDRVAAIAHGQPSDPPKLIHPTFFQRRRQQEHTEFRSLPKSSQEPASSSSPLVLLLGSTLRVKGVREAKKKARRGKCKSRHQRSNSPSRDAGPDQHQTKLSWTTALMDDLIRAHHVEIGHAGVTKTYRSLHRALQGISSLSNGPIRGAIQ
uniref:Uncharacterized protein n=1 Tax=Chromera velia CCMP2878 TaxID=1169474 RepID=A0A0G4G5P2_9ALVE|eukprot:Cvel_20392.t1-p1 / transcript=Cvel_20392.t1 / gene=Cvel_20392 / organism=Chromera_velia_CCMP2878 / gene_product=hypothetical protein / transcript_product=hypothetical protein / location=Cvel_scaffold1826:944-2368(+) / protein_length=475 / sequence_SO=supercontig / SO=protein_coding / is_pseudo=false